MKNTPQGVWGVRNPPYIYKSLEPVGLKGAGREPVGVMLLGARRL